MYIQRGRKNILSRGPCKGPEVAVGLGVKEVPDRARGHMTRMETRSSNQSQEGSHGARPDQITWNLKGHR